MPPTQITRVKPPSLPAGGTIGIVAPASNIKREKVEAGCAVLQNLGYRTVYSESIFDQDLYFAGTVERRARELEEMFERDDVHAVLCARGGYGTNYLLQAVDIEKLIAHPKIFVGYSDVTSLLTWFADTAGLVTFHGPMLTKDFAQADGVDLFSWNNAVRGQPGEIGVNSGLRSLVSGAAEGSLYGGCLSILVASLGTPYEIHTDGTILFLEDVAAKPFQIDRMLMHLKVAGKLDKVRAIIFGEMSDCVQVKDQGYSLEEVVLRVLGDLGIPIGFGLRSGHVSRGNVTLPIGVRASLNLSGTDASLHILEAATAPSATPRS
jgi:muramoyltetrapeptide carboxypeptidase